jgi:2-dehydro-3-deoxyphosphooctonate aldolase (KDO 8-P synthase)
MQVMTLAGRSYSPGKMPLLIAGPCVLEDLGDAIRVGEACREAAEREGFFYIFKSSYLKDNRSSIDSYTGPGLKKGLEAARAAEVCDVLQIPAFLSRQTSLITAAAATGRALNLKKGQFLSPEEMELAVEKARRSGAKEIMVTERGTFFGYNNLVVDFTSFPRMRSFDAPLIFDATHSLQLPGGLENRSGGRPEYARALARAAIAAGCDGLFVETHFAPKTCRCDAEAMMELDEIPALLAETAKLFAIVNESRESR